MEEQSLSFAELVAAFRRRWVRMLAVFLVIVAIGLPVAMLWPPLYRSTATILIEEQEIPRELVRSTITSYADERIQVIGQRVMTRATLMGIVDKYDLYPRERQYVSIEEILEKMRRDVKVQMVSADISDRRTGARTGATIAFRLSYDNAVPAKAQQVANELVTVYLNENIKTRQERAGETSNFLADEAARIAAQIAQIESKLAEFKRNNTGRLPELMQLNMQLRDRAEAELDDLERQIRLVEDRRIYLETQLTVVRENAPIANERTLEPDERLRVLRNQYASLVGLYSESHPDVVRVKREIDALEKSTGGKPSADRKPLEDARNELARLQDRYGPEHPDVVRQRKRVDALESAQPATPKSPDNPAYVSIVAQIESAKREAESLRARRAEIRARMAAYVARIEQTPGIEQEYRDLLRDYENSQLKYRELRAKQMEAQVALELEKDRKGERFSLIDPPQYPEKPVEPNRRKMMAMAVIGSVGGGIGVGALSEMLGGTVTSARALGGLVNAPVLGVVPRAENQAQRRRRRRYIVGTVAILALALVAGILAVHFLVMPLESLWYVLMRRLQI